MPASLFLSVCSTFFSSLGMKYHGQKNNNKFSIGVLDYLY